jgi:uncharacterized membrane protein required for colicin V production
MINEILLNFNFIDILVGCVMIWCVYIGVTKGMVAEILRLLGTFFSTFIALHYYVAFANLLDGIIRLPMSVSRVLSFLVLWLVVVIVFKFVREGCMFILNAKTPPIINRWGGAFVALVQGALICGLMFCIIFISGNKFLSEKAKKSVSGFYVMDLSPGIYRDLFDKVIGKLFPSEKENTAAFRLKESRRR